MSIQSPAGVTGYRPARSVKPFTPVQFRAWPPLILLGKAGGTRVFNCCLPGESGESGESGVWYRGHKSGHLWSRGHPLGTQEEHADSGPVRLEITGLNGIRGAVSVVHRWSQDGSRSAARARAMDAGVTGQRVSSGFRYRFDSGPEKSGHKAPRFDYAEARVETFRGPS